MEEQCSPLNWAYYYQEEGLEELKHSLLYSTLELEAAVEELTRKEDEILQLKGLIAKIIKERDDYQSQCQTLALEKQLLFQQIQAKQHLAQSISTGTTSNSTHEDDQNFHDISFSSNSDENIANNDSTFPPPPPPPPLSVVSQPPVFDPVDKILIKKPLPEKGKFLQAVMEAGPLLQTLLLAGPLPQWQHPPPQINSIDIPPVTISSTSPRILEGFSNKRPMVNREGSDLFSPNPKYQKVVHQSSLTPPTSSSVPIVHD